MRDNLDLVFNGNIFAVYETFTAVRNYIYFLREFHNTSGYDSHDLIKKFKDSKIYRGFSFFFVNSSYDSNHVSVYGRLGFLTYIGYNGVLNYNKYDFIDTFNTPEDIRDYVLKSANYFEKIKNELDSYGAYILSSNTIRTYECYGCPEYWFKDQPYADRIKAYSASMAAVKFCKSNRRKRAYVEGYGLLYLDFNRYGVLTAM